MQTRRFSASASVVILFLLLLTSCSEDPGDQTGQAVDTTHQWSETKWLEVTDEVEPEVWLVSREANVDVAPNHPRLPIVRASLQAAAHRFRESPRMIANRAAQLESMLSETDKQESAVQLIGQLTNVVGEAGQTEGFGAISQHYFNMRSSGLDTNAALQRLKTRYGSRK
ncbi:MAG: hypothetical protein ACK5KM_04760 [Hyphomicrobiaceae bacterium]